MALEKVKKIPMKENVILGIYTNLHNPTTNYLFRVNLINSRKMSEIYANMFKYVNNKNIRMTSLTYF